MKALGHGLLLLLFVPLSACAQATEEAVQEVGANLAEGEAKVDHAGHSHGQADAGAADADSGSPSLLPSTTGPNDPLAQAACGLAGAAPQHLVLASRPEDAATVILVPSATRRYHLHRPSATTPGYAKIQVADWHTHVSFGAPPGVSASIRGAELELATAKNAVCGDTTTDTRYVVHEWGSYLVTFAPTGPDAFYLTIVEQH